MEWREKLCASLAKGSMQIQIRGYKLATLISFAIRKPRLGIVSSMWEILQAEGCSIFSIKAQHRAKQINERGINGMCRCVFFRRRAVRGLTGYFYCAGLS